MLASDPCLDTLRQSLNDGEKLQLPFTAECLRVLAGWLAPPRLPRGTSLPGDRGRRKEPCTCASLCPTASTATPANAEMAETRRSASKTVLNIIGWSPELVPALVDKTEPQIFPELFRRAAKEEDLEASA